MEVSRAVGCGEAINPDMGGKLPLSGKTVASRISGGSKRGRIAVAVKLEKDKGAVSRLTI